MWRQQPQPPDSLLLCPFLMGSRPKLKLVLQLSLRGSGSFTVAAYLSKVTEIEVSPESEVILARFGCMLASSRSYQTTERSMGQEAKPIRTRLDALANRVAAEQSKMEQLQATIQLLQHRLDYTSTPPPPACPDAPAIYSLRTKKTTKAAPGGNPRKRASGASSMLNAKAFSNTPGGTAVRLKGTLCFCCWQSG